MRNSYALVGIIFLVVFLWLVSGFVLRNTPPAYAPQNATTTQRFSEIGNLVRNNPGLEPDVWYLIYEKPGQSALSVPLRFSKGSRCRTDSGAVSCNLSELPYGTRAEVKGVHIANGVGVDELAFAQAPAENGLSIKLYYYDPALDQGPGGAECSSKGLVAVERVIPRSSTPVMDAIRLLLRGELSSEERAQGVISEFPLSGVTLQSATLANGMLTLTFDDPQNRTGGGSCRVNILWKEIEATAKQFPGVSAVRFLPEELFQP